MSNILVSHILVLLISLNNVIPYKGNHTIAYVEENDEALRQEDLGQTKAASQNEGVSLDKYLMSRGAFLEEEGKLMLGHNLLWESDKEKQVNKILMNYKNREFREALDGTNGLHFAGAHHFFHVKSQIEVSNVFKIIRMLPKGAALHMHDITTGSVEYIALNLTYWPNLYICFQPSLDFHTVFRFSEGVPTIQCTSDDSYNWTLVSEFRRKASSFGFVDDLFIKAMSLYTPTPEMDYKDNNGAWYHFGRKIATVGGVVGYIEAMKAYYYKTLQEFYDDNVMYIENRGLLEYIYRLDQSELTPRETLAAYKEVTNQFINTHPDFWGAKYIITPIRTYSTDKMDEIVQVAIQLQKVYPKFFAGFDIVAQEAVGKPNIDYINQLLKAANKGVKFFFHAGETDWHGTKIDDNILDAILLNTTRIGHGNALNGRPYLTKIILDKKIGLEVSPISGQILRLFEDFRMHPAIPLLKADSPIIISSDNPGMWKASGLSYDWYIAFMPMAGQRADLRFLKQLALNSINYSAMNPKEKEQALEKWRLSWGTFLNRVLAQYPMQIDFETIELTTKDPTKLFIQWRQDALSIPGNNPVDAMTFATAKPDGTSTARTVLLRGIDSSGFKIYTDYRSPKGMEIVNNPRGALVFLWVFFRKDGAETFRQIKIEGNLEKVSEKESQTYFESEPILAQIRTAVQNQTRIITDDRATMKRESQALLDKLNQDPSYEIPKPPKWGGYLLRPILMEFFQGGRNNFNDRIQFRKMTQEEINGNYQPGICKGENGWSYFQLGP